MYEAGNADRKATSALDIVAALGRRLTVGLPPGRPRRPPTRRRRSPLLNPQWGDVVTIRRGNLLDIGMVFQGLDQRQAWRLWQPFFDWVAG